MPNRKYGVNFTTLQIENTWEHIVKNKIKNNTLNNKVEYFDTYEEAYDFLDGILKSQDLSSVRPQEKIIIEDNPNSNFNKRLNKLNEKENCSLINCVNVLCYHPDFGGEVLNFAVIVWNKELDKFSFKFLPISKANKIIEIFPQFKMLKKYIKIKKEELKKIKTIQELKHYIVNPINESVSWKYLLNNLSRVNIETEEVDKIFKETLNRQYNNYIGYKFKS